MKEQAEPYKKKPSKDQRICYKVKYLLIHPYYPATWSTTFQYQNILILYQLFTYQYINPTQNSISPFHTNISTRIRYIHPSPLKYINPFHYNKSTLKLQCINPSYSKISTFPISMQQTIHFHYDNPTHSTTSTLPIIICLYSYHPNTSKFRKPYHPFISTLPILTITYRPLRTQYINRSNHNTVLNIPFST